MLTARCCLFAAAGFCQSQLSDPTRQIEGLWILIFLNGDEDMSYLTSRLLTRDLRQIPISANKFDAKQQIYFHLAGKTLLI